MGFSKFSLRPPMAAQTGPRSGCCSQMASTHCWTSSPVGNLILAAGWCCRTKRRTRLLNFNHLHNWVDVNPNPRTSDQAQEPRVRHHINTNPTRHPSASMSLFLPRGLPLLLNFRTLIFEVLLSMVCRSNTGVKMSDNSRNVLWSTPQQFNNDWSTPDWHRWRKGEKQCFLTLNRGMRLSRRRRSSSDSSSSSVLTCLIQAWEMRKSSSAMVTVVRKGEESAVGKRIGYWMELVFGIGLWSVCLTLDLSQNRFSRWKIPYSHAWSRLDFLEYWFLLYFLF